MSRRPAPPGGWPPPERATLGGELVELAPLAADVAELYFEVHPEDLERYGDLAREWEQHDTQHLLNWAIGDVEGHVDLVQAGELAGRRARGARLPASSTSPRTSTSPPRSSSHASPAGPRWRRACARRPRTCATRRRFL